MKVLAGPMSFGSYTERGKLTQASKIPRCLFAAPILCERERLQYISLMSD